MVVPEPVCTPAHVAARTTRRRVVSWVVIDGVAVRSVGQFCCLALVVAVGALMGEWIQVIHRVVPKDQREHAIREIHREALHAIQACTFVHGYVEVFFSANATVNNAVSWKPAQAITPLPLQLRAAAARSLDQTLDRLVESLRSPGVKGAHNVRRRTAPVTFMRNLASQIPAIRLASDASRNTSSLQVSIGWVSDHGDFGTDMLHRGTEINYAEHAALVAAITRINSKYPGRKIEAFSDSKLAVFHIRRHGIGNAKIDPLMRSGKIRVFWVRGHDGHPLNETAHRLAVHTRRSIEWNIPERHRRHIQKQILADLWDQLYPTPSLGDH